MVLPPPKKKATLFTQISSILILSIKKLIGRTMQKQSSLSNLRDLRQNWKAPTDQLNYVNTKFLHQTSKATFKMNKLGKEFSSTMTSNTYKTFL